MKKGIIALAVILMMTLTGCGKSDHSQYSEIYESYGSIKNYSADIKVTALSDEGKTTYTAREYYKEPSLFRLDYTSEGMKGISCVLDGETLKFKDTDGKVTEFKGYVPSERYYIFISDFMERYCKSENAESISKGNNTVLSLKEEGNDPNCHKTELWIKNKTNVPLKMITYDQKGKERIIVEFSDFKMNIKTDKKLFTL